MDLEDLLVEAEKSYHRDILFCKIVNQIVEASIFRTDDEEVNGALREVAVRAASLSLVISNRSTAAQVSFAAGHTT